MPGTPKNQPPAEPLLHQSELEIQEQWEKVACDEPFELANGGVLRVLSPGVWNHAAGPDFLNARLEVNGKILRGDVEIHCRTSDWIAHGHNADPAYANVILHVVRVDDTAPSNVVLLPVVSVLILPEIPPESRPKGHQAACAAIFGRMERPSLTAFLQDAGADRLRQRTGERLASMIAFGSAKAFYTALAEQLGVPDNRMQFKSLAERLRAYPDDVLSAHFEALAWGESDLLPDPAADKRLTPDGLTLASRLWDEWWPLRKRGGERLVFARTCRPLNSPERRLAMFSAWGGAFSPDPCGALAELFSLDGPESILSALGERLGSDESFWAAHTSFRSRELKHHAGLFGRSRLESLLADVVIPVMAAYARLKEDLLLEKRVFSLFRRLPLLQSNSIVRLMSSMCLHDAPAAVSGAASQQGLIHLYKTHCAANSFDCRVCKLYHSFGAEP